MTFIKEGRKMTYLEVVDWLVSLEKNEILNQLEESELVGLYNRVFDWHMAVLKDCLSEAGSLVNKEEAVINEAKALKIITQKAVWDQALVLKNQLEEGEKEVLLSFIKDKYIPEMKAMLPMVTRWEDKYREEIEVCD